MSALPISPKELRDIARYCDAIEKAEEGTAEEGGGGLNLENGIPVINCETDTVVGHLSNPDGTGWAFLQDTVDE